MQTNGMHTPKACFLRYLALSRVCGRLRTSTLCHSCHGICIFAEAGDKRAIIPLCDELGDDIIQCMHAVNLVVTGAHIDEALCLLLLAHNLAQCKAPAG